MASADSTPPFDSLQNSGAGFPVPDVTSYSERNRSFGVMAAAIVVGVLVPLVLSFALRKRGAKKRQSGIVVEAGGEPGLTYRCSRYLSLVESPWEGANTIPELFEQSCVKNDGKPLLGTRKLISKEIVKSSDGKNFEKVSLGGYMWLTYGQAFRKVVNFSSGLVAIGHSKGERVAIFAETRAEWLIALQGCLRRNSTIVTIYASLGDEALAHSLNETEVSTLVCDYKQLKKLLGLSGGLKQLKRVVYINDDESAADSSLSQHTGTWSLHSFSDVESMGQETPVEPDLPTPEDIAVIMYTSGSTGLPKGVMMTHKNLVATVAGMLDAVPIMRPTDVYMAYLPLAHVLELVAEITLCTAGASIGYGSPLTLTDTSSKVKKGTLGDASQLHPTLMTAVPAILDRIRDGVRKTVDGKGGIAKKLFDFAYKRRLAAIEGSVFGAVGLERIFWEALVFKKIRAVLGGQIRGMLSGGAPLSADTQRFINICFGAPIGQGYGLTETCAGATFSEWDDTSVGRVGPPVAQCFLKLINWEEGGYKITDSPMPRGEIVIGGPSVTEGYFNNKEKTDEVYKVDERGVRWFYTGDIGQFHSDGCLEIVDRKKDIVKLQHGEYVSLGKVEAVMAACHYLDCSMAYADSNQSNAVALVVPKQPALESWARSNGISYTDFPDLCSKKEAVKEVLTAMTKVANEGKLQKFEIPTKIKLMSEPWTPESGLVTAALKIKREVIRKVFQEDLKSLYLSR